MMISYKWLQTYFDEKLPTAEKLAELLNFHAFEVEEIKGWDTDDILDVKVLADRACYALCHKGIAGEIAAASGLKLHKLQGSTLSDKVEPCNTVKPPEIDVKKPALCVRYIGRRVENVEIGKSPEWLVARLESIGERSINNVVDAANFVMFDVGQPLHAFDADKIKGAIRIRPAKKGEKMTTLDDREAILDSSVLVIADDEGPLAIAGIKGGKRAEVNTSTKNLILEAASFDRSSVRLTSTALTLKTGASRRFEAGLSPEVAFAGMENFSSLIAELLPEAKFGPINDIYKHKQKLPKIEISAEFIKEKLGVDILEEDILDILNKLNITYIKKGDVLTVTLPSVRTDLNIPEDIVEEVGRVYGYDNVLPMLPPPVRGKPVADKNYYYVEKIKNILTEQGFNEVSLYTQAPKGHFEVIKPLSEDKRYLRENLSVGVSECLTKNTTNVPLLGVSEVRIFEIGSVFGSSGERTHLCIGRRSLTNKDRRNEDILREIENLLGSAFGMPVAAKISTGPSGAIAELDITDLFKTAKLPHSYDDLGFAKISDVEFKPFSQYPFVLRDVAVWTPENIKPEDVFVVIKKHSGEWLKRTDLFDEFKKDGKVSYAYHLVFQSMEKTLTDAEVNGVMAEIAKEMNGKEGWQVR